jgi:hypothetical protein
LWCLYSWRCQVDLLGCGAATQAPSSRDFEIRVDADYWVQIKPVSSLVSMIFNSPIIHSQNM